MSTLSRTNPPSFKLPPTPKDDRWSEEKKNTKEAVSRLKGGSPVSAPVVHAPAAQASCTSGFPDSKEVKLEQTAEESKKGEPPAPTSQSYRNQGPPCTLPLKGKVASGGAPPPMGRQHPGSQDACLLRVTAFCAALYRGWPLPWGSLGFLFWSKG